MKTIFKKSSVLVLFGVLSAPVNAQKFIIYTDEPVMSKKSAEVAEVIKNTYPFSKFNIEFEIVRVASNELECASSNGIERLVTCDNSDEFQSRAMKAGADQAMIVKNMPKWGGSAAVGGGVPVITTGTSARAMLHEYLHTLGMCDEYEYKAEEAGFYCSREKSSPNITFIRPKDKYNGDTDARKSHMMQIPWYNDIMNETPITAAGISLGTGMVDFKKKAAPNSSDIATVLESPTGLFRGRVCDKASPALPSWHPGGLSTIMDDVDAGLGAPMEKIVEQRLISKGFRKKMEIDEPRDRDVVNQPGERPSNDQVLIQPQVAEEVNDTGRNFFKSFFEWLKEIFEGISRAMTR